MPSTKPAVFREHGLHSLSLGKPSLVLTRPFSSLERGCVSDFFQTDPEDVVKESPELDWPRLDRESTSSRVTLRTPLNYKTIVTKVPSSALCGGY